MLQLALILLLAAFLIWGAGWLAVWAAIASVKLTDKFNSFLKGKRNDRNNQP